MFIKITKSIQKIKQTHKLRLLNFTTFIAEDIYIQSKYSKKLSEIEFFILNTRTKTKAKQLVVPVVLTNDPEAQLQEAHEALVKQTIEGISRALQFMPDSIDKPTTH